jgi:hypothetical protein
LKVEETLQCVFEREDDLIVFCLYFDFNSGSGQSEIVASFWNISYVVPLPVKEALYSYHKIFFRGF